MAMEIKEVDFEEQVLRSELPVLVDFWAAWCGPCRMVAPVLEEISRDYEGRLKVFKLNVDDGPTIASRYGIMSIPTLMIFKGGEKVAQMVGVMSKAALEEKIKPHLSGAA